MSNKESCKFLIDHCELVKDGRNQKEMAKLSEISFDNYRKKRAGLENVSKRKLEWEMSNISHSCKLPGYVFDKGLILGEVAAASENLSSKNYCIRLIRSGFGD